MPFLNAFRRGKDDKKTTPVAEPSNGKDQLRGKSFEEQEAALNPANADKQVQPPAPDDKDARAEKLTAAVDKSTEVFDKERKENDPYGESYLDKHYRHQRNKDLKSSIEAKHQPEKKASGYLARRKEKAEIRKKVEAEYEAMREKSPDRARRMRNVEVKQAIQEDARAEAEQLHPDDKKAQDAAYEKIWLRNYKLVREYHGGDSDKEKAVVGVEKEIIKENNQKLHDELMAQAGEDPIRQENAAKIYMATRAKTPKEEQEEAKDKLKAKEKAEEDKRKSDNAELKKQIADKHKGEGFFKGKKAADKEYLEQKKLSAKAQEKKESDKTKGEVKEQNQAPKQQVKSGVIDDKQAAIMMGYHGEKGRKDKNAKMKANMTREEYRANKVHKGDGEKFKANKDVKDVVKVIDGVNQAATTGNKLVAKGGKLLGTEQDTNTMIGQSMTTAGGQKFKLGGTTREAASILKAANGVTSVIGGTSDVVNAIGLRGDADPANRERAKGEIVDGVGKVAKGAVSTTTGVLQSIQSFATDPALAAAMQLEAIPIVGIVGSVLKLIEAAATLAQAAERAHKIVGMREDAKENKDDAMAAALKGLRNADLQLVTSATIDVIAASASIAGHGLTLGGITGPAGVALKGFASGISLMKTAGMACYNSVQASKAKKAQVRFDQAKKNKAGSGEVLKTGKSMITSNVKFALQIVINAAREGDPVALEYMKLFNLDTKNFDEMSDENIRKMILGAIDQDEEPQTLLDKLKAVPNQVRDTKRSLRKKFGAGY